MALLYGPAVRCKPDFNKWRVVLRFCIRVCAPGHHGYPRAPDLIFGKALRVAALSVCQLIQELLQEMSSWTTRPGRRLFGVIVLDSCVGP